jgi:hypothetical protein
MRGDLAAKSHVRQLQSDNSLPVAVATGDTKPLAEGRFACPVFGQDSERIREMSLETEERGEVDLAAIAISMRGRSNIRRLVQQEYAEYYYDTDGNSWSGEDHHCRVLESNVALAALD